MSSAELLKRVLMLNSCAIWQNETVSAKDSLCRKAAFMSSALLTCSPVPVGKKAKVENEMPFMDRLMDVLLSLLAKASGHLPSAPLRDAAEGLFRVFAGHLTSTGDPLTWKCCKCMLVGIASLTWAHPLGEALCGSFTCAIVL